MVPKPTRSSDTSASGRNETATDHDDVQEAIPSFSTTRSPADLARIRAFSDVIRDAIGEYGSINELSPAQAAGRENLGTMKSLHRRGRMPFDKGLCMHAAGGGHLEVLQWLRQNVCLWDEETCLMVASGGHLKVLRWARGNACP